MKEWKVRVQEAWHVIFHHKKKTWNVVIHEKDSRVWCRTREGQLRDEWQIRDFCVSLWASGHRWGLVSSSSPTFSSYYDSTCQVRDRLSHICEKHTHTQIFDRFCYVTFLLLHDALSHILSLTGLSGSCVPMRCPRSGTLWHAAPPSGCRKPMRIGCGPSPPPLRNPPSWTDSSCFHWALAHTRRAEISVNVIVQSWVILRHWMAN